MKKLLTVLLVLAFAGVINAKDLEKNNYVMNQSQYMIHRDNYSSPYDYYNRGNHKNAHTQGYLKGDTLIYMRINNLQHLFGPTTPVCYDPSSNMLLIAMTTFHFDEAGAFQGTTMWNLRTTNDGASWDSVYVYRDPNKLVAPTRPSVITTNPTKSTNLEDINSLTYGINIWNRIDSTAPLSLKWNGGIFSFYTKEFQGYITQKYTSPELGGNTTDPQVWTHLQLSAVNDSNQVYGYGKLEPRDSTVNNGYYGYFGFDFDIDAQDFISNNPEEWWVKHFGVPRGETGDVGDYEGSITTGHDSQGNLYSVFQNYMADDDRQRYVAFSKSTDDGKTWTDLERIPREIYSNFASKFGTGYDAWWPAYAQAAYHPKGLLVRGVNDFSYFSNLLVYSSSDSTLPTKSLIVDTRYNNGVWSISEVQELNYLSGPITFENYDLPGGDPNKTYLLLRSSEGGPWFGNNIEISKTADGKKIVLYWIDVVPNKFVHFPETEVYVRQLDQANNVVINPITIDSLGVSDIFAKIYDVETNTWGDVINLTNDDKGQYTFHVPEYIKDINHAIILSYETNIDRVKDVAPKPILETYISFNPYLFVDVVNLNKSSVETNQLDFNVSLNDAYPNPVMNTNNVEISFNMERPSVVSLNLFDNIGNKVATILDNHYATSGINAVNFDISNLNSGAYFYQLTVDGHTFTKKLMIAK